MDDIYFYIAKLKEVDNLFFVKAMTPPDQTGIYQRQGRMAAPSDFAIATGAYAAKDYFIDPRQRKKLLKERSGIYWTRELFNITAKCVSYDGTWGNDLVTRRDSIGIRPATSFSSIEPFAEVTKDLGKYLEVKFGYYPQTIAPKSIQDDLYEKFLYEALPETGNVYTIDARNIGKRRCYSEERLNEDEYEYLKEYEYDGKKYVRACINSGDYIIHGINHPIYKNGKKTSIERLPAVFSDGQTYETGKYAFFEVEPIIWCVDKEQDTVLSKKILLGGIQLDYHTRYRGDYLNTTMNWFLNDCFAKEIVQNMDYRNTKTSNNQKHLTKKL